MAQIKIQDLLPLLKPGFVAMDKDGTWCWYSFCTSHNDFSWGFNAKFMDEYICLSDVFDIAPFEGDWKDSLMECGNIHEGGTK